MRSTKGLLGPGSLVWVGPPFDASDPSCGSAPFCTSVPVASPQEESSDQLKPPENLLPSIWQLGPPCGVAITDVREKRLALLPVLTLAPSLTPVTVLSTTVE